MIKNKYTALYIFFNCSHLEKKIAKCARDANYAGILRSKIFINQIS